jgi:hypothetical protein
VASLADLQSFGQSVAAQYGIPWDIFNWQINQESGWNPNPPANPGSTASGIAQFVNGTAQQFNLNTSDPYASLTAAAQLDAQDYAKTGSWTGALTQYGTLANASAATMASFNNVLSNLGLPTGTSSNSGTTASGQTAGQVAESDSFVMKIAMIVLGIVLIGGAIIVYGKSRV